MCRVHSWSRFDVDLWPRGLIYRLLSCLHVRPVTFVSFEIGIPYFAHGSITMRGFVKYIHDPDMTLNFDLKVKFIGYMTWLCVQASAFLSFDIVILCLAYEWITMVRCVAYIHDLDLTLNYDLKVNFIGFLTCFRVQASVFFVLWHNHSLFGMWVYHHGMMCSIHSWTLYDLDLWPHYQNYIFTMNLSLAKCLCSLT